MVLITCEILFKSLGGYNTLCGPENTSIVSVGSSEALDGAHQYASSSHYPQPHLHQQQHYPVMGHSDFGNYGPIYGGPSGYSSYGKYRTNPYQRPSSPLTHTTSCKAFFCVF